MTKIVYNALEDTLDYINKSADFKGNFKPSSGIWAYASAQAFSGGRYYHQGAPATDFELANKKYVDDSVIAGGGYTDEQAQDAVGTILGVGFVYNDAGNTITLESYIASASAVSRFADSSNIRARFPGSSNLNRTLINTISSNLDTRIDSLFNWSSNKGIYYPSGIGAGLSGSYASHRQDATIHFTKSSIDDDYQGSSQALSKFTSSSQVNRVLLNLISSNLDSRIDNLFSWSSNALTLYGASSHTHGAFYSWSGATGFYSVSSNYLGHSSNSDIHYPSSQLISWLNALYQESGTSSTSDVAWSGAYQFYAVSSLFDSRLDSLFNYSSNTKSLYYLSSLGHFYTGSGAKLHSIYISTSTGVFAIASHTHSSTDVAWSGAYQFYSISSLNKTQYNQYVGHSSNTTVHSFNAANYITSTNAIRRFADSSSILSKYTASGKIVGLTLSRMTPANGEVLKWNSANNYWSSQADSTGSGTFDQTQYITSTNSIARFADSANINAKILPANYTNGWAYVSSLSTVAHGYGTRPTMVGLTPSGNDTFGYSLTYDATNITFYLSVAGKHWVNWFAGGFLPSSALKLWFDQLYTPAVFKSGWARISSQSIINHQLGEIPDSVAVTASGENAIGISFKNIDENSIRVYITDDDFHTVSWNVGGTSPQVCGYNTEEELTGRLNDNYVGSSQVNKTWILSISSNLDGKIDLLGSFNPQDYIISTTAISRFADSSNIRGKYSWSSQINRPLLNSVSSNIRIDITRLYGFSTNAHIIYANSSNINRNLLNSISGSLDTRIDSLFNWSSNKSVYYPSSVGHFFTNSGTKLHSSYLSGQRVLDLFNHLIYGTSSNLIARFAQSSVVNTNLITAISGNLDARIDSLYNWSSNKGIYYPSSVGHFFTGSGNKLHTSYLSANKVLDRFDHTLYGTSSSLIARFAASTSVNNALITSISSNLDARVDSLFNWSSNKSIYYPSSVGHYFTGSGTKLHSSYLSANKVLDTFNHTLYGTSSSLIARFAASTNVNNALITSISSNLDTRVDSIFGYSSNAKNLYADSSNVRFRFVASSISLSRYSQHVGHSGNTSKHVSIGFSSNSKWVYTWLNTSGSQLSSLLKSGNEYSQAYKSSQASKIHSYHAVISSQYIKDYIASSTAKSVFAASSQINRTLLNTISSNIDIRFDSIFSYSSNAKYLYADSGNVRGRFADSSNVRFRFVASSISLSRYNQYVGHSGNTTIHTTATDEAKWNDIVSSGVKYTSSYRWYTESGVKLSTHENDATIHVTTTDTANWNNILASGNEYTSAYKYINPSGSLLANLLGSGNEYTSAYKSSQLLKIHSFHALISSSYLTSTIQSLITSGTKYTSAYKSANTGVFPSKTEFTTHTGDTAVHVNGTEETEWDTAYTHSQIAGGNSVHVSTTENTQWDWAYSSWVASGNEIYASYKHSANAGLHSFNPINYITSTNSIIRFSNSSSVNIKTSGSLHKLWLWSSNNKTNWTDLTDTGETSLHKHDSMYYTETELNAGQLNNIYYTETELNAGQLNNLYYTETELNNGQLNNLYYTETESKANFAGSSNVRTRFRASSAAGTTKWNYVSSARISGGWWAPLFPSKPTATSAYAGRIIRTSGNANGTWVWICINSDATTWDWYQIAYAT